MNSFFISLGGGNEIGASSYYLHIDGMNFLLDAGLRYVNRKRYPAFSELSKFQFIDGVNDLDAIFISHAHYDHNGALPLLVSKLIEKKDIFCSEYTKKFTEIQLNILKKKMGILQYELYEDIMVDRTLGMIKECPINQRVTNKEYNFTLYDSGHIPGATMIYLERGEKKVLYTGDFSDREYAITKRYNLPTIENLDLLIINSTYAHRKEDIDSWKLGENQLKKVLEHIKLYKKVNLKINHVNQGMELAIFLNEELENKGNENIKIYVDEPVYQMLSVLKEGEKREYKNIHLYQGYKKGDSCDIYISLKNREELKNIVALNLNYSLHSSYQGIKELILNLNPKKTLITHYSEENMTDDLIKDLEELGYFNCEYVKNEEIYDF